ncbi:acyltransferase family protein [Enhygromyxa salina]|uniref:Acyltransferase family protein n=1 Tax=Enhygromyxa salina TaxID=215803 RepID=A0A0C2DEB4_9BACT|nr:1-acyl-sn-glycerol-3-phosphate acyltransferase [Enhygromyxa salina]KIG18007.1 acyltransferase family protein [Enhygromyxa salina]
MKLETRLTTRAWDRAMRLLRAYHSYEVVGLSAFPRSGPVLVASTHSLATYENFLLGSVALDALGRRPIILADDLLFKLPAVGNAMRDIGVWPGKRDAAIEILRNGGLLGLGPGGMREALRSTKQHYTFDWEGRLGFVWIALLTGAPIVLAACPAADDIFDVADLPITADFYKKYHLPLPLFRGVGPTLVPRPVKLWHVFEEPIVADIDPNEVTEAAVIEHHAYLCQRMHGLMQRAIEISGLSSRS